MAPIGAGIGQGLDQSIAEKVAEGLSRSLGAGPLGAGDASAFDMSMRRAGAVGAGAGPTSLFGAGAAGGLQANADGSVSALGGAVNVTGPKAAEFAQEVQSIYESSPQARAAADAAIATGETVDVRLADLGEDASSTSTLESADNIEDVNINLAQESYYGLNHLAMHEVFGHAFGNHRDADRLGVVGDNQRFLSQAYAGMGVDIGGPQGYGTRFG